MNLARARARDGLRTTAALAVAVAGLSITAGAAASGGVAGGVARGGGVGPPPRPQLSDIRCIAKCAGLHRATAGSKVQASGRHLKGVKKVAFNAKHGGWVKVAPGSTSKRSLRATVPSKAISGRPRVVDGFHNGDTSPQRLTILDHLPPGGSFKLREARATPSKSYYDGARSPHLTYLFAADGPTDVRINIVRRNTHGVVERSFIRKNVEPNTENTIVWDGRGDNGKQAPSGSYRFSVGPVNAGTLDTADAARFGFYEYKFPVRGRHTYGDGIGAGRHHQGQDVLAGCGTPLVAARGGRVQWREKNPAQAGGYGLVIDGTATGHDFVYFHMLHLPKLHKGDRVRTGQKIGLVGQTGDATACHLHFEIWSAPGWYEGGHFTNPTDDLKRWDKWS